MTQSTLRAYNIADLREQAQRRLPKGLFEFVDRGAEDETSLRDNRAAFDRIKLHPRVLRDVSGRSQAIELFDREHAMPIAIAPTGVAGLLWHEGELALARAAAAAGIPFTLATSSMTAMETVAEQAGGTLWFQIYMYRDPALSRTLIDRAKAAGFEGLVVTVDTPVYANREYNDRNGFSLPMTYGLRNSVDVLGHPRWLVRVLLRYLMTTGMPRHRNTPTRVGGSVSHPPVGRAFPLNDSLTWSDVRGLRTAWPHRLIVKGILHPEDAILAADCGADAVIVSNHGGRVLDGSLAPIDALPAVVEAVAKRLIVMVDSGFRRGSDVIKALCLGARAVLIGRSTLYGVAAAGEAGATRAITVLREEIDRVLAQMGCCGIKDLGPQHLRRSTVLEEMGNNGG
jgi:isopentenyl diphosphate isomerase/L-lactate dehydrogenase-like FMN-dependent dehydrogenase